MKKIKLNVSALLSFYANEGIPTEVIDDIAPLLTDVEMGSTLLKEDSKLMVIGIDIAGEPRSILTLPISAKALVVVVDAEEELAKLVQRQAKLLAELSTVNEQIAKFSGKKFH